MPDAADTQANPAQTTQAKIETAGGAFLDFINNLGVGPELDISIQHIKQAIFHALLHFDPLAHSAASDAENLKESREGTSPSVGKGHHGGDPHK